MTAVEQVRDRVNRLLAVTSRDPESTAADREVAICIEGCVTAIEELAALLGVDV